MADNVILCVMGMMFPRTEMRDGAPVKALPSENVFSSEQSDSRFAGIQANEAPIKYLIERGAKSGCPVTNVVYLCSDKVLEPIITHDMAEGIVRASEARYPMSTEGFLVARIDQFCEDNGYASPSFDPIAYNPLRPADSISAITAMGWDDSMVSIDITGGQRDAVLLLSTVIQLLKLGSRGTTIGDIVYSNLAERMIIRQNNTYDLIDLINAVNAFTEYGRADQLNAFFGKRKKWTTPETKKLVSAMNDFSDSLSLCQVAGIEEQVKTIHASLQEVERCLSRKVEIYNLFTDAINQIEEPSWLYELGFDDAIKKLSEIDQRVSLNLLDKPGFENQLREWQWDYVIERNELLFLSLIPSVREKFVPAVNQPGELVIQIIRWCVNHQMIQQALCIYRELISRCLLDRGFFEKTDAFDLLDDESQDAELTDICLNCSINPDGLMVHAAGGRFNEPNENIRIARAEEHRLRLIVAWFRYLHATRNAVMHVSNDRGSYAYFFAMALLDKDPSAKPSINQLKSDILKALDAIEQPTSVSSQRWNQARSTASRNLRRYREHNESAAGSRNEQSRHQSPNANSSRERTPSSSSIGSMIDPETQARLAAMFGQADK